MSDSGRHYWLFWLGVLIWLSSSLAGASDMTAQSNHDELIRGFIDRVIDFNEHKTSSGTSEGESGQDFSALIRAEARALQPQVPEILDALGVWLGLRSKEELEIEDWAMKSLQEDSTGEELLRYIKSREGKTNSVPRCALTFLVSELGFSAPARAVDVLLDALPMPETSEDHCVLLGLRKLGPDAYESLVRRILAEDSLAPIYIGTVALLVQSIETDFVLIAGLGPVEVWEDNLPHSKRKLKALVRKWQTWWFGAESVYSWDSETSLLKQTAEDR